MELFLHNGKVFSEISKIALTIYWVKIQEGGQLYSKSGNYDWLTSLP